MGVLMLSFIPLAAIRGANATTAPTGIIVPLYAYPTDGAWDAVVQAKSAYPNVPFVVVINPDSGSGTSPDPNYAAGVKNLQAAGVVVLGYVPTGYATKPSSAISNVEAQVSAYDSWYHVNGIFFDEMSNVVGYESYYSTLNSYVKSLGMTYTVGNPGATVPTSYIGTLDTLVIYENGALPTLSTLSYPGYATTNFAIVAYAVASPSQSFVASSSGFAAWVYFTDGISPNPYGSLPSYFADEVAMLSVVPPAPTTTTTQSSSTKPPAMGVNSVDLVGSPIAGLWTTIQTKGGALASGFTPMSYPFVAGASYTVCIASYASYLFSNWANGNTSPCISVSPTQDTVLTAYYTTGIAAASPLIAVRTVDLSGSPIAGVWTTFQSSGLTVATGFTPTSYTGSSGTLYTVCVSSYANYAFNRWSDGSTNPCATISPTQDTALTAYYDTGASVTSTTTTASTSAVIVAAAATTTASLGSGGNRLD
jgi:spherulation-specific family 4 protein